MRKFILLAAALVMSLSAMAYDYPYLALESSDGTLRTVEIEGLSLAIENGQLILTNPDSNVVLPLSDLNKMYFSTTTTSISGVTDKGTISGEVEVFDLKGVAMGKYVSLNEAVASLTHGTYLIKSSLKTIKIAVK